MQAEILIEELGNNFGIEGLRFDENTSCCLELNDFVLSIKWQKADNVLLIYAPLFIGLEQLGPDIYEYLLTANLFGEETKNMQLAIYKPSSAIILSESLDIANLKPELLEAFLAFFVDEAKNLQTKINEFKQGANISTVNHYFQAEQFIQV